MLERAAAHRCSVKAADPAKRQGTKGDYIAGEKRWGFAQISISRPRRPFWAAHLDVVKFPRRSTPVCPVRLICLIVVIRSLVDDRVEEAESNGIADHVQDDVYR